MATFIDGLKDTITQLCALHILRSELNRLLAEIEILSQFEREGTASFDKASLKQQVVIHYSDGSEEYHDDLGPAVLLRVKQWCANRTPLLRSSCGAVIEASLDDAEERAALDVFAGHLFDLRKGLAETMAGGSFDGLVDLEDRKTGPDDWLGLIAELRSIGGGDLESFKVSMLSISHEAYAAYRWAQRKQDKEALIAEHGKHAEAP